MNNPGCPDLGSLQHCRLWREASQPFWLADRCHRHPMARDEHSPPEPARPKCRGAAAGPPSGLVVGAGTNAPTCPAPSRARPSLQWPVALSRRGGQPRPSTLARSTEAQVADHGALDLRLGNHPISGDYPAPSRRACWPHKPGRCWPPSASGSKE